MAAEIAPDLFRLPGVGQGVNAYLWYPRSGPERLDAPILFDCGWPWSGQGLVGSLVALGCAPSALPAIAITHDDIDHCGRLASLQAVSGARVFAHQLEAPRISGHNWRTLPTPGAYPNPAALVADVMAHRYPHQPVLVTDALRDGDMLPGGWQTVHTPGHTPGHTSYYHGGSGLLIVGDAIGAHLNPFNLRLPMSLYCEELDVAGESICRLAALRPSIICFGHGEPLYDAAEPLKELAERATQRMTHAERA